jgi:hypothetical protein
MFAPLRHWTFCPIAQPCAMLHKSNVADTIPAKEDET